MNWKKFRSIFNERLEQFLDNKIATVKPFLYDTTLQESFAYLQTFQQGGKRIRPYMLYLLYEAFADKNKETDIIQLSLTPELVHLFALVHDDIIDKGDIRHSNPTYHKKLEELYKTTNTQKPKETGKSQAMLMGDLLYTWAWENMHMHTTNKKAKNFLSELLQEVIIGQMIDVHLSVMPLVDSIDPILEKDKQKSGYYTFTRPMMLGGILADVPEKTLKKIQSIGTTIALAFQLRDDLLDITDPSRNKTSFSDLKEGNQTVILFNTYEAIDQEKRDFILSYRGKDFDKTTEEKIFTIIKNSGAIEKTKKLINDYLDQASNNRKNLLSEENPSRQHLLDVIEFLKV